MIRQYSKITKRLFSDLAIDSKKPLNLDRLPKLDAKLYSQPIVFATNLVAEKDETREDTFKRYIDVGTQVLFAEDDEEVELCKDLVDRHGIWNPLVGRTIQPSGIWTVGDRLKQNEAT